MKTTLQTLATTSLLLPLLLFSGCAQSRDDVPRLDRLSQLLDLGRHEELIPKAEAYVRDFPKSARGWSTLAWAYVKADRLDKAQRCIDNTLALDPKWDNGWVAQGVLYRKQQRLDDARRAYQQAISLQPRNPEALASLVVIELIEGNYDKAVDYGERAWALRKDYATIPANLSVAYHFAGNAGQRDVYYRHAERLGYPSLSKLQALYAEPAAPATGR